jgi:pantoate--beta-alanine ligase
MRIIRHANELQNALKTLRSNSMPIALVPTMGALHKGHLSLIKRAKTLGAQVVVSIFVNPKQFGPHEDLSRYPRPEADDIALCESEGVDLLWMPPVDVMYPDGFLTKVSIAKLGDGLCGAARPGHFDGVCTVVAKLFGQIKPDYAIFGEKDWQQLAILQQLNRDLDYGITIIPAPIIRDDDGLALSSRNVYLSQEDRKAALNIPRLLNEATTKIINGDDIQKTLNHIKTSLFSVGFSQVDYVSLVNASTLEDCIEAKGTMRLLVAAKIGTTRLIDNIAVVMPF